MVFEPKVMATTVQGQNTDSSSHLWKSTYQKLDQLIMSACFFRQVLFFEFDGHKEREVVV